MGNQNRSPFALFSFGPCRVLNFGCFTLSAFPIPSQYHIYISHTVFCPYEALKYVEYRWIWICTPMWQVLKHLETTEIFNRSHHHLGIWILQSSDYRLGCTPIAYIPFLYTTEEVEQRCSQTSPIHPFIFFHILLVVFDLRITEHSRVALWTTECLSSLMR